MFSLQWYIENIIAPLFVGSILIVLAYFFDQMVEHLKKTVFRLDFSRIWDRIPKLAIYNKPA